MEIKVTGQMTADGGHIIKTNGPDVKEHTLVLYPYSEEVRDALFVKGTEYMSIKRRDWQDESFARYEKAAAQAVGIEPGQKFYVEYLD